MPENEGNDTFVGAIVVLDSTSLSSMSMIDWWIEVGAGSGGEWRFEEGNEVDLGLEGREACAC